MDPLIIQIIISGTLFWGCQKKKHMRNKTSYQHCSSRGPCIVKVYNFVGRGFLCIKIGKLTKLVRGFYRFCGRFSDLEIVMAINLDIKSLLKRTLNQCGPVFFSKIEIKGTFVSASHWRVCLGHGRVMRVCERCVSARLFTFGTFFREYSFEFMLHWRKFTINVGLFPRTKKKKKINVLPKRI